MTFIRKALVSDGENPPPLENHPAQGAAADSPRKGSKSIRYKLGSYIDNPATLILTMPMLLEKEVIVQWAFDEHNRLIEIFVDKQTATY